MYYGFVGIAVVMFGLQFLANEQYQKETGSGFFQANLYSLLGCIFSLPILLLINGFQFEYTHFTLFMACVNCFNALLFSICTLKALEKVNLSVFSLLSMLGGMILPLLAGILFFSEKMTIGIALCVLFIFVALIFTVEKDAKGEKGAFVYYVGVFVCNGMSGVISKIYADAPYLKVSNAGYSILTTLVAAIVSLTFILILWNKKPKISNKAILFGVVSGPLLRGANYLLLIALSVLPASINYPMVTGGTIVVSTLLSYFTEKKPNKKEWIAVVLSFSGILFLTLLPV